jgi:hypothetical protein
MTHYLLTVHGPAEMDEYGNYGSKEEMEEAFAATGAFNDETAGGRTFPPPRGRLDRQVGHAEHIAYTNCHPLVALTKAADRQGGVQAAKTPRCDRARIVRAAPPAPGRGTAGAAR